MHRAALFVFFVGMAFSGIAQKIITGKVLDESNSFPLHHATVIAGRMAGIKQTDENGIFRMYVPDTVKTLVIRCTGFVEKEVSITSAGWMDIRLKKPCFFNEALIMQGYNQAYTKSQVPAWMIEF